MKQFLFVLGLALILACGLAAQDGGSGVSKEPRIGKLRAGKILFLGNSITLHPPAEGMMGAWGMAASAPDKDYVHLVSASIGKAAGIEPKVKVKAIADFERKYESYDVAANLKDELAFKADIVIVAIGENVPGLTDPAKEKYAASFARLLGELKSHGNPALFVRSSFWPDTTKDSVMKKACIDAGGVFIDLGGLGRDASNFARAERTFNNSGIGIHPGDKGMKAIADTIWSAIQKRSTE